MMRGCDQTFSTVPTIGRKQNESEPARLAAFAQLKQEFPAATPDQIQSAYDLAGDLIHAGCEWADQYRGPNNDGRGVPTFQLADRCPGFSTGAIDGGKSGGCIWRSSRLLIRRGREARQIRLRRRRKCQITF